MKAKQKTSKPKVPPPMRELTVKRSRLIRNILWSGDCGCGCLTGHALKAAGIAARRLDGATYSFAAERVPQSIARLVEPVQASSPTRFALTLEASARVVHPFDEGREKDALRNFRDYGWAVRILEDR